MSKAQRARRHAREHARQLRLLDVERRKIDESLAEWKARETPEERVSREWLNAEMEARFRPWFAEHGEQLGRDLDEAAAFGQRVNAWTGRMLAYLYERTYRREHGLLGSGSTKRLRKKRDKAIARPG